MMGGGGRCWLKRVSMTYDLVALETWGDFEEADEGGQAHPELRGSCRRRQMVKDICTQIMGMTKSLGTHNRNAAKKA